MTGDGRQQTADSRQQTADSRQQTLTKQCSDENENQNAVNVKLEFDHKQGSEYSHLSTLKQTGQ